MKAKEYRENIVSKVAKIRRTSDLDLICKIADLHVRLQANSCTDRDIDVWLILSRILKDDVSDELIGNVKTFVSSYLNGMEKRKAAQHDKA